MISTPPSTAGGTPAIVSTLKHGLSQMGPFRTLKTLSTINQVDGFDCPGCAWPDPPPKLPSGGGAGEGHRSAAEFCENGAKAVAEEATLARITADLFAKHTVQDLAEQSDHWLGKCGRLTEPMVLRPGQSHYEPIDWPDAFDLIAHHLHALESPDEAVFYTSGRTSNEAAFLYQLFVRKFGTNNLPDCSNMCHESSGAAMNEAIGVGKGTVSLDDFDKADAIFVIGQNPGTNHPRMLTALQSAARRGCKIVSINPLREPGLMRFEHPQEPLALLGKSTQLTDLYLQVRINGDVALLKGIMKSMLEADATSLPEAGIYQPERNPIIGDGSLSDQGRQQRRILDHDFIHTHTTGFNAFRAALDAVSWDDIVDQSGIDRAQIDEAADIAMGAKNLIACWAMGLTQHKNAVANIQEIVNLLLLGGWIGKPGSGACPVRGHSNVQGDRTMGIYEKMSDAFLDKLGTEFNFEPPRKHGYDTVDAIQAMHDGKAHVFVAMGGNFLSATPDTEYTADALRQCKLTVHVSTKLNRSHLITGNTALILPCLGRTEVDIQPSSSKQSKPNVTSPSPIPMGDGAGGPSEQFVTVEDSMSMVHTSRGSLPPASPKLLSEPAIVAHLATAVLGPELYAAPSEEETHVRSPQNWGLGGQTWADLAANYDRIRNHIEHVIPGFDNFNQRVREPGGFQLPNGARDRNFRTGSGKAQFTVHPLPNMKLADGEFIMMTIRTHDQYNTTIYGLDDRYRGIKGGRRVVLMNERDIVDAGLSSADFVDLTCSAAGRVRTAERFLVVPFDIPRRCVATYFPEANAIVPVEITADKSNTPASKSVIITIKPSQ